MIRIPLRILPLFLFGLLSVALLAACSSEDEADDGNGEGGDETTVSVTLEEWKIQADPATVPVGKTVFSVENTGTVSHEMVIVRSEADPGSLPVEEGKVPEDEVDVVGEIEEFGPGEMETGTFTLEAGSYVLICNIAGHYSQGMHLAFTVQ